MTGVMRVPIASQDDRPQQLAANPMLIIAAETAIQCLQPIAKTLGPGLRRDVVFFKCNRERN